MNTVYLIRHGKTPANEKGLYCGSTDLPLSPAGRAELQVLREKYPPLTHCRFVTSGMARAEETLDILFGEVPHIRDPWLREVDFGDFEMGSYGELKDTAAFQAWLAGDNETNVPPNGESGARMRARVLEAFARWRQGEQDTVIVTHGGPIAAIMEALFPEAGKSRYQWQPRHGHGYAITPTGYGAIPAIKQDL